MISPSQSLPHPSFLCLFPSASNLLDPSLAAAGSVLIEQERLVAFLPSLWGFSGQFKGISPRRLNASSSSSSYGYLVAHASFSEAVRGEPAPELRVALQTPRDQVLS